MLASPFKSRRPPKKWQKSLCAAFGVAEAMRTTPLRERRARRERGSVI